MKRLKTQKSPAATRQPPPLKSLPADIQGYARDAQEATDKVEGDEFEVGEAYNRIAKARAHRAAGLKDAKLFWNAYVKSDINGSMAALYGRLATTFSRDTVLHYHPSHLDELISLCKRQHIKPWPDPGKQPIHVPQAGGGFVDKPFIECTRDELKAAKKGRAPDAPPPPPPPPKPLPAAAAALVDAAMDELGPMLNDDGRDPIRFSAEPHGHDAWFSLVNVDSARLIEALQRLTEAVRRYQQLNGYPRQDDD